MENFEKSSRLDKWKERFNKTQEDVKKKAEDILRRMSDTLKDADSVDGVDVSKEREELVSLREEWKEGNGAVGEGEEIDQLEELLDQLVEAEQSGDKELAEAIKARLMGDELMKAPKE